MGFDINHEFFFFKLVDGEIVSVITSEVYPSVSQSLRYLKGYDYMLNTKYGDLWGIHLLNKRNGYEPVLIKHVPKALEAYALLIGIPKV
jgi:hypothetical protein